MKFWFLFFAISISFAARMSWAQDGSVAATLEAPKAPEWIVSYDFLNYGLEGTKTASTRIYKFGEANINMHLLGLTWLASPNWTLLTLVPYLETTIQTIYEPVPGAGNVKLQDQVNGLGDVRLMAISPIFANGTHKLTYDLGGTAPTGSVDKYFSSVPTQRASYNMQTGSGTVDLIAGLSYSYTPVTAWTNSLRTQGTGRLGRNYHDYSLGNEFVGQASSRYQIGRFNVGGIFNYKSRGAVHGRDGKYELFNNYVSPSDPTIQGNGHQFYRATQTNWDVNVVGKFQYPIGKVNASLEAGLPLAQKFINKDDVDLKVRYWVAASLNTMF